MHNVIQVEFPMITRISPVGGRDKFDLASDDVEMRVSVGYGLGKQGKKDNHPLY